MSIAHSQRIGLRLLGDFDLLIDEEPVSLPPAEQRLLAFLACAERPVSRSRVIGELWPDTESGHAQGRLRSSLWRVRRCGFAAIRSVGHSLRLDPAVSVDLHAGTRLARQVSDSDEPLPRDAPGRLRLLGHDLLPHWFDEWLEPYRGHYHRIRVQALEDAGRKLMNDGRPSAAVVVAAEAVGAEPLRDSAHWMLIRAYTAEGNHGKAVEQYRSYVEVLRAELGVPVPLSFLEILDGAVETAIATPSGLYEKQKENSREMRNR